MNVDDFIQWLDDIEPRSFYNSDIIDELRTFGFDVDFVPSTKSSDDNYFSIAYNGNVAKIRVNTWQDDFDSLVYRGLPFFVIDESHIGETEYHETDRAGYAIVNPQDVDMNQLAMIGAGYIYKNEKSLEQMTVVGGSIYRNLALIIANEAPGDKYHGRGFAAQADLKAIKQALGVDD